MIERRTTPPRPTHAPARRAGFTVLELMLALTIFSLVSISVMMVFRTGTRTYEASHRELAIIQRARYAMDAFEQDVMNLFYRDETSYNVAARQMLEEYQRQYLVADQTGNWTDFENRYGPRDARRADEQDPNHIGNPFEKTRTIDLQFAAQDGGDFDTLTFALRQPWELGGERMDWGLARVEWSVTEDILIRSMETVDTAPRSWDNQVLEKPERPSYTMIAQGVDRFNLSYGFWWDNQWYEVDDWASGDRQIRNAQYLLGDYDYDDDAVGTGSPQPGAPGWNEYLNAQENQPLDRVPTYVRLELWLRDPERPARTMRFGRVYRIPNSQETWTPNRTIEEYDQIAERELRDQRYRAVYPGALRKR